MYYNLISSMNKVSTLPVNPVFSTLVHSWSFDGNSLDSKGSSDGTVVGGAGYVSGLLGNKISLDGVNDYVSLPSGSLSGNLNFSISMWVSPDTLSGQFGFISSLKSDLSSGILIYKLNNTGNVGIYIGGFGQQSFSNPVVVGNNHIGITYQNGFGTKLYMNGSPSGVILNTSFSNNSDASIGYYGYTPGGYMDGGIELVNYFGSTLTDADMVTLYNGGLGLKY